jgi:hypothetical protein
VKVKVIGCVRVQGQCRGGHDSSGVNILDFDDQQDCGTHVPRYSKWPFDSSVESCDPCVQWCEP